MAQAFKLIVAGGRDFMDRDLLGKYILGLCIGGDLDAYQVSIVSGMARGADMLAYDWAKKQGVVTHEFPADWDKHGKAAGFRRNEAMGQFADGLLAFWDGQSKGTQHMIQFMEKLGKPVHIVKY